MINLFGRKKDEPNSETASYVIAKVFFNALNANIIGSWESDRYVHPLDDRDKLIISEVEDNRWK